MNKPEVSFIMPTLNRRQWVCRAVNSCLSVPKSEVIILDGGSTDGAYELLNKRYRRQPRVTLLSLPGMECMARWMSGVELAQADYATFMFDDDVLSPYWPHVLKAAQGVGFACGLGECGPVEKTMAFKKPNHFDLQALSPQTLLSHYASGDYQFLPKRGLPVSPICCVTQTSTLRQWCLQVTAFIKDVTIRHHFAITVNAGPDLMVYLLSLARRPPVKQVPVLDSIVAQFSAHPGSISCGMDPLDHALAYWLPLVWLDGYLRHTWDIEAADYYRTFTVKHGWDLYNRRATAGKTEWQTEFAHEINSL